MPPSPTSRRQDRAQPAGSANRSRMYNLGGHAHSSGSLLPRSTDVHAPSISATSPGGVEASEAPYLTNIVSHFGRSTLTAPDNLLRKQAKEKKQKIRQKKAQNAQAAAAALAGATQTAVASSSTGRNAVATNSTSNLLDPNRRYQSTLDDAPVSTGLLPPLHMGMRRAYSGNQTATLASTSYLSTPPPVTTTTQTTVARTRRRRQSQQGAKAADLLPELVARVVLTARSPSTKLTLPALRPRHHLVQNRLRMTDRLDLAPKVHPLCSDDLSTLSLRRRICRPQRRRHISRTTTNFNASPKCLE